MSHPILKSPLLEALADLEVQLETPVIPGELCEWTDLLSTTLQCAESQLSQTIEIDHATQLAQITGEDPELMRQADQLREEDQHTREKLKAVRSQLDRFASRTEAAGQDEGSLEERFEQLIETGLHFVLHARRQEICFENCVLESFYRDRGVAD